MRQYQALPVLSQHFFRAYRLKLQTGAGIAWFQQQVHFSVMAQRLKMADSFHRIGNGFFVQDLAGVELNIDAKTFLNQSLDNLNLHIAHDPDLNLLELFIPDNAQLRNLIFQDSQFRQERCGLTPFGQAHLIR